jgi:hypothetical protein
MNAYVNVEYQPSKASWICGLVMSPSRRMAHATGPQLKTFIDIDLDFC